MALSKLRSINRPFALMILSGLLCFGIIQIWLKFPNSIPLAIFIAAALAAAIASIVYEIKLVMRVAKEATGSFRNAWPIPKLRILRLFLALLVSNVFLVYSYYRYGLGVGYILAANVGVILSLIVSQTAMIKRGQ